MKVFLDDEQKAPPGWVLATNVEECIDLLSTDTVNELSLDYWLGPNKATGHLVLTWIQKNVLNNDFVPPKTLIHYNGVERDKQRMQSLVKQIYADSRRIRICDLTLGRMYRVANTHKFFPNRIGILQFIAGATKSTAVLSNPGDVTKVFAVHMIELMPVIMEQR